MAETDRDRALKYHRLEPAGKLAIAATKPMANQRDLSLAYSPGVAAACEAIAEQPSQAADFTIRSNLVAVVTNGSAVLGLGNIGPLAAKPVMEGKAVLFKKFSNIDVFDLEIAENDPDRFIDTVARLEPTFGGINLEDIKAPECFYIEKELDRRLNIPVLHDDQHGTAIIVAAAVINALRLVDKDVTQVKLVSSGAGAAALACLNMLLKIGVPLENMTVTDIVGVVYEGRSELMDEYKAEFAKDTTQRTLAEAIEGADIFLGLSAANVLQPSMVAAMAERPIVLALANPNPEILPDAVAAVRGDAIVATGRSDYPNQVNNVLCFPYLFRGALDVGATSINDEMKIACAYALAELARAESSDRAAKAYGGGHLQFGPEYIIPKPFDPRLMRNVASAVARAAMDSGVASRPIEDFDQYQQKLDDFVFRSGFVMKPIFDQARAHPKRLTFAEGESHRVLQAVQQIVDYEFASPILVGRPEVIASRIRKLNLRLRVDRDFEIVNPQRDARFKQYWQAYHAILGRKGVSPDQAKYVVRTQNTVVAALMLHLDDADAMLCGAIGPFQMHLRHIDGVIGRAPGVVDLSTLAAVILPTGTYFVCDSHVTPDPSAAEIAEMTLLAATEVRRFGIEPKIALLSHSNFGSHTNALSEKVQQAFRILRKTAPDLEIDGEMHADAALSEEIRRRRYPESPLKGSANLLVMPNIDAAHISYNLLKMLGGGGGTSIGPILIGAAKPCHILSNTVTVRGLYNMAALAVVGAGSLERTPA